MVHETLSDALASFRLRRVDEWGGSGPWPELPVPLPCIGDVLITTDADGLVTSLNPMACLWTGWTQNRAAGRPLAAVFLLVHEATRRPIACPTFRALRDGFAVLPAHTLLIAEDGTERLIEGSGGPIPAAGGMAAVVLIFRDITERTRLERACRREMEVLTDLNRRKDEFLAMLAHELRNPLAPIRNAVHILGLLGDENLVQKRARALIERQVGQLDRLINDLLDIASIGADRVRLQPERLDLRDIVAGAVEAARALLDRKGHELTVELPPDPVWLTADPTRLAQVVVNLLNNAAKYTDAGGQIGLSLRREGGEAVLRLRDTGVGIEAELLPRIFDLFTQAERTLDHSQGGLGIGLALVRRLVELHGGTVEVSSAGTGLGSEFIVRLPLVTAVWRAPIIPVVAGN